MLKRDVVPKFAIANGLAMATLNFAQTRAAFPPGVTEQEFALAQRVMPRLKWKHW
jgi:hypothetical protein